ncbi:MAG: hypothetical protein MUC49_21065 [Raineya sp.]|jgi:hypothetical protein|nr:hypothetical protein [Raineya sp.]
MKNLILVSALILSSSVVYSQNAKENRIDISGNFPLDIAQASRMPEIQKLPIGDLIGFGVNPEDIKARTRIISNQKGHVALKNDKGLYVITVVENLSFDLLGSVVSFQIPSSSKKSTLIQTTAAQDKIASFQFEKDGQIFSFYRFDQNLDEAKINGKQKSFKGFSQRLLTSRYIHVSKFSQVSLVEDLFKRNTSFIFSFKKMKNKNYCLEGNAFQIKEQLRYLFAEYKTDVDAFIVTNRLFESNEKIEKDLLILTEYIITNKYPKISNVKTGTDEFEVLEVEAK